MQFSVKRYVSLIIDFTFKNDYHGWSAWASVPCIRGLILLADCPYRIPQALHRSQALIGSPIWRIKPQLLPACERARLSYDRAKSIGLAYSQPRINSPPQVCSHSACRYHERRLAQSLSKILGPAYRSHHPCGWCCYDAAYNPI